jgi:osmoprotectant transport system ATP-binding protein
MILKIISSIAMNIQKPIVSLSDISVSFQEKPVLDNLTAYFTQGKVTALLGKSGSGKSTLLQCINGMLIPKSGRVDVFDKAFDYMNASNIRLQIGYVVQHVGLFPHLTIYENIRLLGKISKQSEIQMQERTQFLMDAVQLSSQYLSKYPHQLSGGEQQRVGLCRALFLKPPLLLMDEPFASLDYGTRSGIYTYFKSLQETEPCSVILVTHQFEEAEILADEFLWLANGKVNQRGVKADFASIKSDYLSVL